MPPNIVVIITTTTNIITIIIIIIVIIIIISILPGDGGVGRYFKIINNGRFGRCYDGSVDKRCKSWQKSVLPPGAAGK